MVKPVEEQLVERFFRYLAVASQSDVRATSLPSTPGQLRLARLLSEELESLNASDVHLDENGILTARIPGTVPDAPCIGFVAHLDTVDVGLSPEIRPQRLRFQGDDLLLNKEAGIWLRVDDHPEILRYKGEEILFGDGTSVLGADNKAAIAVVMTLVEELLRKRPRYGDIVVAFVPDEEIGLRGAKALDLARFPAAFAYTIDCCERGEVVYETFNAASVVIDITGVPAHPMSAKGVLVNPILVAADLMSLFDRKQTPEHTAGREGYWWFNGITGDQSAAQIKMAIRDFDAEIFEERKSFVLESVEKIQERYPRAKIECRIEDSYRNIAAALGGKRDSVDLVLRAMAELGITSKVVAMRGGTDGSALSARGLPTPNYFTGALNFHSRFEFLPISSFCDSFRVTQRICELAAE